MKVRFAKDPLVPLEGIVHVLLGFMAAIFVLGAIFVVANPGSGNFSLLGVGHSEVCVDNVGIYIGGEDLTAEEKEDFGLKPGSSLSTGDATACITDPGLREQALSGLTVAPTFLVFLSFLLLTNRTIKRARATGLFTRETARRVQQIGRFLLIGILLAALVEWVAKGLLLSTMFDDRGWADGPPYISVAALIGALGVVTVGRVFARAVELQDEADATV